MMSMNEVLLWLAAIGLAIASAPTVLYMYDIIILALLNLLDYISSMCVY